MTRDINGIRSVAICDCRFDEAVRKLVSLQRWDPQWDIAELVSRS